MPFWDPAFVRPPAQEQSIAVAEARLGVTLPAAFLDLMRQQDGGRALDFDYRGPEEWAMVFNDRVLPLAEMTTLAEEWEGEDLEDEAAPLGALDRIVIFSKHGFRLYSCFDYRESGPHGEPAVIGIVVDIDLPEIRHRVADFSALLEELVEAPP